MGNPYRTSPEDPERPPAPVELGVGTTAFGLLCAVLGAAAAGADRGRCLVIATAVGTALILLRRRAAR